MSTGMGLSSMSGIFSDVMGGVLGYQEQWKFKVREQNKTKQRLEQKSYMRRSKI